MAARPTLNNPVVSVVIPTHNHTAFLWESIASIFQQTLAVATEIIVVDDASNNHSAQLVANHFGARYVRIEAKNVCQARNLGTSLAKGEIVVYLDADNYLLPNFFAETVPKVLSGQADVVYGRRQDIGDYDPHQQYNGYNHFPVNFESLLITGSIDTCSAVRRSQLVEKPWDEHISRYTDWDFHLSNLERGMRYHFVDTEIFAYRWQKRSTAEMDDIVRRAEFSDRYIRQKHARPYDDPSIITVALPTIGRYYCFDDWLNSLTGIEYAKERLVLLITDNSNDPLFFKEKILPFIRKYEKSYRAIAYKRFYSPTVHQAHTSGDPKSYLRVRRFSEIFNFIFSHTDTQLLWCLEDDTSCEPQTLNRLIKLLSNDHEAVGATVVQRSRSVKYGCVAYEWQDNQPLNLFYARGNGADKITTSGSGCLLLKTAAIKQYKFSGEPSDFGFDMMLGLKFHQEGKYMVTDWSMSAPHHVLSPGGKVYKLTFDNFDQPDWLFTRSYLNSGRYAKPKNNTKLATTNLPSQPPTPINLLLQGVQDPKEVIDWLRQSGLNHQHQYYYHHLILVPANAAAYSSLAAENWPPGTVLKDWQANLLVTINNFVVSNGHNLIISHIKTRPVVGFSELTTRLCNYNTPLVFGESNSLNCAVIYCDIFDQPIFNEKLSANLAQAAECLIADAKRSGFTVLTNRQLADESAVPFANQPDIKQNHQPINIHRHFWNSRLLDPLNRLAIWFFSQYYVASHKGVGARKSIYQLRRIAGQFK